MVDRTCIICREDMEYRGPPEGPVVGEDGEAVPVQPPPPPSNGPNDTPKKLPCGHVFHFHCLRSWLERQQSCPTWSVISSHPSNRQKLIVDSEQSSSSPRFGTSPSTDESPRSSTRRSSSSRARNLARPNQHRTKPRSRRIRQRLPRTPLPSRSGSPSSADRSARRSDPSSPPQRRRTASRPASQSTRERFPSSSPDDRSSQSSR